MKCKKFIYAREFENMPKETNFQLVEEELPSLKDDEVLCEVLCLSVDPYMRSYAGRGHVKLGQDFLNFFVAGKVIESKDHRFPVGTVVQGPMNCRTHAVMATSSLIKLDFLQDLPVCIGLGTAGMPGLTAYYGLLEICHPKAGETVYVNSAAGGVGAVVGQIAKIRGCFVVGSAGTDEKVAYCKSIGFDEVFNYKTVSSLEDALKAACPKGIDCFFENVGGPGFSTVIKRMNKFGRVAICGAISSYNKTVLEKCDDVVLDMLKNQLCVEGFGIFRWKNEWESGSKQLVQWIKEGKIKTKEHVTKGFENLPRALIDVLSGINLGKAVVMI